MTLHGLIVHICAFAPLQAFTQQNRVKCLLMTVAARHLSDTAIGDLKEVFSYVVSRP